jgi:hypothetical protein
MYTMALVDSMEISSNRDMASSNVVVACVGNREGSLHNSDAR